jgi:hypothetical protein
MFGRELTSDQIVAGLRRINPSISASTTDFAAAGLWLGEPKKGRYLGAFRRGAVPEFTQLGTGGKWMVKGWRAIFGKVVAARAATTRQIEQQFGVVLETDGLDGSCIACRREGVLKAAEANGKRLCGAHQEVNDFATSGNAKRQYVREVQKLLTSRRHQRRAEKEIDACLSGP